MREGNHLSGVRSQYEELPYPERNPLDEKSRIQMTIFDGIDRINHVCHSGRKDFAAGSRVLIAGGGTGDATIFLAEQLRDTTSEIVYLDFSRASLEVARERARVRGLDNIIWIHDSILNIPSLGLGSFDHISCTGVLHHLEDPGKGLCALESVLTEDGSMLVMVYGRYGRTVVYQMQELLNMVNLGLSDTGDKIRNCRKLMGSLHRNHWLQYVKQRYSDRQDIELYDLFLHSQDRPYTIPELYDLVEGAGLRIVKLLYENQGAGSYLYEPRMYIHDAEMLESINRLPVREQQAIAELLNGRIERHTLYAAREIKPQADSYMLDFIPSLPLTTTTVRADYQKACLAAATSSDIVVISVDGFNADITARKTTHIEEFFRFLDGKRTLQQIYDMIIAAKPAGSVNYGILSEEFKGLFAAMSKCDYLVMRHKSVLAYRTAEDIQRLMVR